MLGRLDSVMGLLVVALVTGAALVLLVQIQGDLRRLRHTASDADPYDGLRQMLRRLMPLRARIGAVAAAMLTAAALQLATPAQGATETPVADGDAGLLDVVHVAPQGLDTATLVTLVLVVLLIGLGAPFWFDAARGLLGGRPEAPPPPPASADDQDNLDKAA